MLEESGELESRRAEQHRRWLWSYVEERLVRMARERRGAEVSRLEREVREGRLSPGAAADSVVSQLLGGGGGS